MAVPGGGLSTRGRIELARSLRATVLVATPSYALHLAEVAAAEKLDPQGLGVRLVIVAGEPGGSLPAVRRRLAELWAAEVLDHAGATEVGPWGVGDLRGPGLDVLEPWFHPEFISTETGAAAGPGELSELVLTTLGRAGAPVIRYRTGDLVRPQWASADDVAAGACPWVRLAGGILGRTDDMLVIRGVNVFPGAIDDIVRGFPEVVEYRVIVRSRDSLDELAVEIEDRLAAPERVAQDFQVRLGLRVDVRAVPPAACRGSKARPGDSWTNGGAEHERTCSHRHRPLRRGAGGRRDRDHLERRDAGCLFAAAAPRRLPLRHVPGTAGRAAAARAAAGALPGRRRSTGDHGDAAGGAIRLRDRVFRRPLERHLHARLPAGIGLKPRTGRG
jgi:hypothetical protein